MIRLAAIVLFLAVCGFLSETLGAPRLGPPIVCHPINIGELESSLPFGEGGWRARDENFPVSSVPGTTMKILMRSKNTLVHMETIRRAVVYLQEFQEDKGDPAQRDRFLDLLRIRLTVLQMEGGEGAKRRLGLAQFDYGYALAALDELGYRPKGTRDISKSSLAQAARLRPSDGALHLGVALASFSHGDREARNLHLKKAMELGGKKDSLLRKNIMGTLGRFMNAGTYEELARKVGSTKH